MIGRDDQSIKVWKDVKGQEKTFIMLIYLKEDLFPHSINIFIVVFLYWMLGILLYNIYKA